MISSKAEAALTQVEVRRAINAWRLRTGRNLVDLAEESKVGIGSIYMIASGRKLPAAWVVKRVYAVVSS